MEEITADIKNLITETVQTFIKDWTEAPRLWLDEIDIQCDLASRLRNKLFENGLGKIHAGHLDKRYDELPGGDYFSRIACEPYVLPHTGKAIHPDIVIWDDLEDHAENSICSGTWPIVWACELKYNWAPSSAGDQEKMKDLSATGYVQSVSCLDFVGTPSSSENQEFTLNKKKGFLEIHPNTK